MIDITKRLNKIKNSKDGKTLIANFGYLSLLQITSNLFPFITMPYLARIIGVEGFGKIAFAGAIMVWLQTVSDWGFNYTATRDVAKNRDNKEKISEIFSDVFWARCTLVAISFLLLLLLLALVPKFNENKEIILVSFLLIPGYLMFPDWFFQAIEKMRYITVLNITSKLLFTVAVFVFVKEKADFVLQPLLVSFGYIISGIIAMYFILIRWKIKLKKPRFSIITRTIKNSTDIFINNLAPNLYNSLSIVILGFLGGGIANGKLDAGNKFVRIGQEFMSVTSRTFYPFLSRKIDKHGLYTKINIYLSLLISLLLFISAPFLIKLFFTSEFYDSIIVLQIMSFSTFFLALSNIYGTNFMIIQGFEKELRNITLVCSIVGFALSFPLIYFFNFIGAAVTIVFTRAILGLSIMWKANRIKNTNTISILSNENSHIS